MAVRTLGATSLGKRITKKQLFRLVVLSHFLGNIVAVESFCKLRRNALLIFGKTNLDYFAARVHFVQTKMLRPRTAFPEGVLLSSPRSRLFSAHGF